MQAVKSFRVTCSFRLKPKYFNGERDLRPLSLKIMGKPKANRILVYRTTALIEIEKISWLLLAQTLRIQKLSIHLMILKND